MESRYQHQAHEQALYQRWEEAGLFRPPPSPPPDAAPFSIIMPPPNANDPLHVGHAMFAALEDAFVRFHRARGDDALWLPGTDHAGIETQFVFEKKLQKEGKSRFDFDRASLFQLIMKYVEDNSGVAIEQLKRLGASADWSRYQFTLDEKIVKQVQATFVRMVEEGLIYRELQLVNFCTKCGTSYSELEVENEARLSPLYYLKYGPLVVATTRPETTLGDEALAVHPDDARYLKWQGKLIEAHGAFGIKKLPVITDQFVDPEFGTGVVKITPAHDHNDFLVARKHHLPLTQIIGTDGRLTTQAGRYARLTVNQAREVIVTELEKQALIEKIDSKYSNSVGVCYRCKRPIEPLPLAQFFLRVRDPKNNLVGKALGFLERGETRIYGAGREKILRHWLENLRDWNLSRQVVWGIAQPIWYQVEGYEEQLFINFITAKGERKEGNLASLLEDHPLDEIRAGLQNLRAELGVPFLANSTPPNVAGAWLPETDTLDTWFSSAQWPIVTLKALGEADFQRWYPSSLMETGYDILPFWVMRMMLMAGYLTQETPFREIYLHGLVRDEKGQKMSKSKGNVLNPLEVVEEYGADALRLALVIRSTPGQDKSVGKADFRAMRNFTNKIWNATRYLIQHLGAERSGAPTIDKAGENREGGLSYQSDFKRRLEQLTQETIALFEKRQLGLAADQLYDHFWHWFCDECLEAHKAGQLSDEEILNGLKQLLLLLHPLVPFVTEAAWQELVAANLIAPSLLAEARFADYHTTSL